MTTYSYPSDTFPTNPKIALDVPEGWEPLIVPATILATGRVTEAGTFRPNVIVAISRYGAGYELQVAIDAVIAKFGSLEQAAQIGSDVSTINGREWAHIESSFVDSRVGTLVQAAHLAIVEHGEVVDLIQVTGTVTGSQAQDGLINEIREIQRSVVATVG